MSPLKCPLTTESRTDNVANKFLLQLTGFARQKRDKRKPIFLHETAQFHHVVRDVQKK